MDMSNIAVTVDKSAVRVATNSLQEHLHSATKVTAENSWSELQEARKSLWKAQGIFDALHELKLLPEWQIISENLILINLSHKDIAREKQKIYQRKRRK